MEEGRLEAQVPQLLDRSAAARPSEILVDFAAGQARGTHQVDGLADQCVEAHVA